MTYQKDAAESGTTGPVRKKLKTSDIPLSSATRQSIDDLAHKFKKKGGYDSLRKQVWEDLEKSDFEAEFQQNLIKVAEEEIEKNPSQLLKLDRGKAAALIEGAVDRAGVYQTAESRIDALIDAHLEEIETGIRVLRKEDVGEETALMEHARGGKTDEQYAEDAKRRREAREKVRQEAREKELAFLDEKRKEERARRKEEERKAEMEQEKRRAEREARRKAEREREEEKNDRYKKSDEPSRRDSTRDVKEVSVKEVSVKPELSKEEIERLEQEALNDLLKEGKKLSQRSRHQLEIEIDESLAPPPKKIAPASAINVDVKKPIAPPTGPKADAFKTPYRPSDKYDDRYDRRRSQAGAAAATVGTAPIEEIAEKIAVDVLAETAAYLLIDDEATAQTAATVTETASVTGAEIDAKKKLRGGRPTKLPVRRFPRCLDGPNARNGRRRLGGLTMLELRVLCLHGRERVLAREEEIGVARELGVGHGPPDAEAGSRGRRALQVSIDTYLERAVAGALVEIVLSSEREVEVGTGMLKIETPADLVRRRSLVDAADREVGVADEIEIGTGRGLGREAAVRI
ncbi:uncharacterized protein L3040_002554 [Drepanopeziza brunnea f. sp. 'multigermtubi']|uniref:uncharacterized protein n=1 Tax=Drepanopeziza brunnea f. sp. 'multigermtubi' TaxID=698441 RepID=UPI00238422BA|nr:hypothetical protein L3040_002554 [Drepanopeziza brunnea f. sp. 'multigermtubi']